jgi:hypothetical protein
LIERKGARLATVDEQSRARRGAAELDRRDARGDRVERGFERRAIALDPFVAGRGERCAQVAIGVGPLPERLLGEGDLRLRAGRGRDGERASKALERELVLPGAPLRDALLNERVRFGCSVRGRGHGRCALRVGRGGSVHEGEAGQERRGVMRAKRRHDGFK